jgi:hypothetical protein
MPAGAPIKRRTTVSYQRDVEAMVRLKSAIYLDQTVPKDLQRKCIAALDKATELVVRVRDSVERE